MIEEPWKAKNKQRNPWDKPPKSTAMPNGYAGHSSTGMPDWENHDGSCSDNSQTSSEEWPEDVRETVERLRDRFPHGADISVKRNGGSWTVSASSSKTYFRGFGGGNLDELDLGGDPATGPSTRPSSESSTSGNKRNLILEVIIAVVVWGLILKGLFS